MIKRKIPFLFLIIVLIAYPSKTQTTPNLFYVATAVDTLGIESSFSNETSATVTNAHHTVNLTWVASTSNVSGYNIYRGTKSGGPYTKLNTSVITTLTYSDVYTIPNPPTGLQGVTP